MKRIDSTEVTKSRGQAFTPELASGTAAEPLEVNVIFTGIKPTAAALKTADSLACQLGAHIRLRAGIVVPRQLPLDQPLVSVKFFEQELRNLVNRPAPDSLEQTIHLYICRDWADTLSEVLKPDSLAVMAVHPKWWPTAESRLIRALRAKGIRLLLVDVRGKAAASPWAIRNVAASLLADRTRKTSAGYRSLRADEVK
jgi:hypothetical protein